MASYNASIGDGLAWADGRHWQLYVETTRAVTADTLRNFIIRDSFGAPVSGHIWVEPRRAVDRQQTIAYCTKPATRWHPPGGGAGGGGGGGSGDDGEDGDDGDDDGGGGGHGPPNGRSEGGDMHAEGPMAVKDGVAVSSKNEAAGQESADGAVSTRAASLASSGGVQRKPSAPQAWRQIWEKIKTGADVADLVEDYPQHVAMYSRGLTKLTDFARGKKSKQREKVEVFLFWGQTGTGKSHRVYKEIEELQQKQKENKEKVQEAFWKMHGHWFDGYCGEEILVMDDFSGDLGKQGLQNMERLKHILDKYPCRVEEKGSSSWAEWTRVYITSNLPLEMWWQDVKRTDAFNEHLHAIARRIPKQNRFFIGNVDTLTPEMKGYAQVCVPQTHEEFEAMLVRLRSSRA